MTTIKEIVQIGVGMPERETFAHFSHDMLGLPTTTSPDGAVTYMRVDRYGHRLAARTAAEPVLNYIGFDVGGASCRRRVTRPIVAKTGWGDDIVARVPLLDPILGFVACHLRHRD